MGKRQRRRDEVDRLIEQAIRVRVPGSADARRQLIVGWGNGNGVVVATRLAHRLEEAVAGVWSRGWEPRDVSRAVERHTGRRLAPLVIELIGAQARHYRHAAAADPGWLRQVDELGAVGAARTAGAGAVSLEGDWLAPWVDRQRIGVEEALALSLDLLVALRCLPSLPRLRVPPQEWGRRRLNQRDHTDDKMLARVRALLAKAESTTFPEEAAAFVAKAEELMTRHAIDAALLDAVEGSTPDASGRRIHIDNPYASAKSILLAQVAAASRCEAVWCPDIAFSTVFGFETDLDAVELLYTSLLVQATSSMVVAGGQGARHRTRSYRQSFLVAFATRIGERLRGAAREAVAVAQAEHGDRLLPVLAGRAEAVTTARARAFPETRRRSLGARDALGWAAGRTAAELASLACGERMLDG